MAYVRSTQTMIFDNYTDLPSVAMDGDLAFCKDTQLSYRYNLAMTTWAPLTRELVKVGTVTIDGKTTGVTNIYTLEGSGTLNFYPAQIVIRAVSVTGAAIKPTFSVGSNASTYDNIASGSMLNTVTSLLGITSQPQNVSTSPALAGGTVIKCNVTIGATATTYTFKIDILGYYAS